MLKRTLAVLLAAILVVALVGCGSQKRQPVQLTLSTEDAEDILAAAGVVLPDYEEAVGADTTITYLYYYDDFHNYSQDELIQTGYWTFQNKYNGNVVWSETTWADLSNDLAQAVLGGTPPDFTRAWESNFPTFFTQQMLAPVGDYIDYNDPLWAEVKYFSDTFFSIGGEPYMFITDIQNNSCVLYNRRVFSEYGFDDPAELFYNDEWTWDKMFDMAMDFSDPDENRYAFNSWHTDASFLSSTGTYVVLLDQETGKFYSNYDDPRLERGALMLMDFNKNDLHYPIWNTWSLNRGESAGGMKEGETLFGMDSRFILDEMVSREAFENIYGDAGDVMVVPVPRDPNGDGEYYIDSVPSGYCLCKNAPHPEAVALLAACERFKIIDPTVVRIDERQKREKLGWTQEMLDMWNEMYKIAKSKTTIVQYTNLGNAQTYLGNMIGFNNWDNPSSWAELKEANKDALDNAVNELNEMLASYDPNAEVTAN